MKSIAELYHEVLASEELKKEFLALKPEEVEGFAEKYGCKATLDEIKAYIIERNSASGELSDDELNQVAGGKGPNESEAKLSIFSLGIGCAAAALISAVNGDCGTAIEDDDKMLCDRLF